MTSKELLVSESDVDDLMDRVLQRTELECFARGPVEHSTLTRVMRSNNVSFPFRELKLRGELDGVLLEATVLYVRFSGFLGVRVLAAAGFGPLWLDLRMAGRPAPALNVGPGDDPLSDIEEEYAFDTGDYDYLADLLTGEVRRRLLAANHRGYRPRLTDRRLDLDGSFLTDSGAVVDVLRTCAALQLAIEARRTQIAPSRLHGAVLAALELAARQVEGRLDSHTLSLDAEHLEGRFFVQVEHPDYARWSTQLSFHFAHALGPSLAVAPVRRFYELWFSPDAKTGDKRFDRDFSVRASSEEHARLLLDAPTRGALTDLRRLGDELLVTERAIELSVDHAPEDAEWLRGACSAVIAAAEALSAHRPGTQAYR